MKYNDSRNTDKKPQVKIADTNLKGGCCNRVVDFHDKQSAEPDGNQKYRREDLNNDLKKQFCPTRKSANQDMNDDMGAAIPGAGGAQKNRPDAKKAGRLLGPGGGQMNDVPTEHLNHNAAHHGQKSNQ
jgi:hypothetical protein